MPEMKNNHLRVSHHIGKSHVQPKGRCRLAMTPVGAAVFLAIYGPPNAAIAQQAVAVVDQLSEVTVTATRRTQTLEGVPYSISVVSGEQLEQADVTDIASLATQVPGLSLYDYGARLVGATVPIIRGINADSEPRGFRTFEQAPVGTYIGNSPIDGYFDLQDLKQVEVLRGPQGTLYGAGALGGALRLIPNSPELGTWAGKVEAGGSRTEHSSGTGYIVDGLINAPLGDTFAFRASAKYLYEPGFIDAYGLFKRTNSSYLGIPLLANPADPVSSPAIYSSREDWNWEKTFTGRASMLWKPVESFSAELAFLNSNVQGDGGPQVNMAFPGGISPLDPLTTLPPGGRYQEFTQIDQPFSRYTNLASLDMSYDAGFATLSTTSSYYTTSGFTVEDQSYNLAGVDGGAFLPYYAGIPANPRFVFAQQFSDSAHTFTQEVRLVSKTDPASVLDYVLGFFYENQARTGNWYIANPGSPERAVAEGCTGPAVFGASPPNCLLTSGPNDLTFVQIDRQTFQDRSVFGELTWHFMPHGQITFGARHFSQSFTDAQSYLDYTFPTDLPATPRSEAASKTVGKVNPSYEYADHQYVYALWSQGFRRGGANSVPEAGIFQESPLLRTYAPDETNNYEAGLKGRFDNGLSYTFAVFDIRWSKPQIFASLPSGNLAVYNANTAESKGFEVQSSGPLFLPGFGYTVGVSYADAKLTSDFSLPANNGLGVITPGELTGTAGEQLPGSPKTSVDATLTYSFVMPSDYELTTALNANYRTPIKFALAPTLGATAVSESSSFQTLNYSVILTHKPWRLMAYVKNLLDKEEVLVPPAQPNELNNLTDDVVVNRPREVGVRIAYMF
jgi:outer membrane receptor protein involved in Fe transport